VKKKRDEVIEILRTTPVGSSVSLVVSRQETTGSNITKVYHQTLGGSRAGRVRGGSVNLFRFTRGKTFAWDRFIWGRD